MQKGFTLVEIIIVVVIMSIFAGFGFTTYTRQIQKAELDKQVDTFVNVLRFAKDRAVGKDLSSNPSCTTFSNYRVRVASSNNQFIQQFICTTPSATTDVGQWFKMNNVVFKNLSADVYIPFYPPYGCTNAACTGSEFTLTIKNPGNGSCVNVTVNRLGNVIVGSPYVSGC